MPRSRFPTRVFTRGALCGLAVLLGSVQPAIAQVDQTLLAGMSARAIGPAGMSGRVADVVAAPSDPNVVYVGAATGGVWRWMTGC